MVSKIVVIITKVNILFCIHIMIMIIIDDDDFTFRRREIPKFLFDLCCNIEYLLIIMRVFARLKLNVCHVFLSDTLHENVKQCKVIRKILRL